MNDDKLMNAASRLKTEIAPQRDLWAGIAESIEEPQSRRWGPMFAQAAAVVLLIGASSAITYVATKGPIQGPEILSPDLVFEQASFGNRYNLGAGFQDARNGLVAELDIELARLSPEAQQAIQTNLKIIREAVNSTNDALEEDPENTLLQVRLLKMYREELALLRRVSGLTRNLMMRNDI